MWGFAELIFLGLFGLLALFGSGLGVLVFRDDILDRRARRRREKSEAMTPVKPASLPARIAAPPIAPRPPTHPRLPPAPRPAPASRPPPVPRPTPVKKKQLIEVIERYNLRTPDDFNRRSN